MTNAVKMEKTPPTVLRGPIVFVVQQHRELKTQHPSILRSLWLSEPQAFHCRERKPGKLR